MASFVRGFMTGVERTNLKVKGSERRILIGRRSR